MHVEAAGEVGGGAGLGVGGEGVVEDLEAVGGARLGDAVEGVCWGRGCGSSGEEVLVEWESWGGGCGVGMSVGAGAQGERGKGGGGRCGGAKCWRGRW